MKAVIMAGGEGTRLRPLTCERPKPMALVCGRPAIEYILDLLSLHGCDEAVITLGYLGEKIESHFETGHYNGIKLHFSYEDAPLGTAGSVKKAAKLFQEPFVVISGDALCDFNLHQALTFHQNHNAVATIIAKQVDDPREYGLVVSSDGKINGFSEKPSYLSAVSDLANTGVYILSPSVLELIPDNTKYDFARDVFPQMLYRDINLMCYQEDGYWCDIGDFESYMRCQKDILDGLVKCQLPAPEIAKGIFSHSEIPEHVKIKPPCFIGKNVILGEGTKLDSGSILCDHVCIGKNTRIYGSVLLDHVYVSDNVTCNRSIICENAKVKSRAEIFENAVIGSGAVIGEKAQIKSGVRIWNNKLIHDGQTIVSDIKYGAKGKIEFSDNGFVGETNVDITVEFAARLGCSVASCSERICAVSSSSAKSALAIKKALISGILSTGKSVADCGEVTIPIMIHTAKLISADICVHISSGANTVIKITDGDGLPISRQKERAIEGGMNRGEFPTASWDKFGSVKNITNSAMLYGASLYNHANFKSRYSIRVLCQNSALLRLVTPFFEQISSKEGEVIEIHLDSHGMTTEFFTERLGKIPHDRLVLIACAQLMREGYDIALPHEFAACADALADKYQRRVYRWFSCPNDDSDFKARALAKTQPFFKDGVILALYVLHLMEKNNTTLKEELNTIPKFNSENRFVTIKLPPQRILNSLFDTSHGIGEGVIYHENNDRVLIRSAKQGNGLYLFAESTSAETAKSLCDSVEKLIEAFENNEKDKL